MRTLIVFGVGMAAGLAIAGLRIGPPAAAQSNAPQPRGIACPCPGDADCDGAVNFADITEVLTNWGITCAPDTDGDGVQDKTDNCPTTFNPDQEDTDQDGMGDACDPSLTDNDQDGWPTPLDCDDNNPQVNPAATEVCNNIDDDCDGQIDENAFSAFIWYFDADGDGWGDFGMSILSCTPPPGYVEYGGDCNDLNPEVYPGQTEYCDGLDNNCNGQFDENCVPIP